MKPDPWITLVVVSTAVLFAAAGVLTLSAPPAPRPLFQVTMGQSR